MSARGADIFVVGTTQDKLLIRVLNMTRSVVQSDIVKYIRRETMKNKLMQITSRYILFLSVFTLISSCKGQKNSETNSTANSSIAVGKLVSEVPAKIWVVYQDTKSNYWFGSNGEGVFMYNGTTLRKFTTEDGLIDNTIRGIQGDSSGHVYIETPDGISQYNGESFESFTPIKSRNNKWKLAPNDLWFNCNGNPNDVYRYDGESLYELTLPRKNINKAFGADVRGVPFTGMNNSPYSVYGIDKDKEGNLWFGTVSAGAFRFDGESFLWIAEKELTTLPDGRVPGVRSMLEDKDGNIWLSNFISRYRIVQKEGEIAYEKLPGVDMSTGQFEDRLPYFNSGLKDMHKDLWMTTYGGGVWKYDGEKLLNFPIMDGDTEVLLVSIFEDKQGVLWLGTDNAGVYTFTGSRFEKFKL